MNCKLIDIVFFQFGSPIAKAWTLQNSNLNELSLFDKGNVPALVDSDDSSSEEPAPESPLIYVGQYFCTLFFKLAFD